MSESRRSTPGFRRHETHTKQQDFTELRRLLVGAEQDLLRDHDRKLFRLKGGVSAADVSEVLPEAVRMRTSIDTRLPEALAPTIENSLHESVRKNPQGIVDAIFPVIGPAIRRSISEALAGLVRNLNGTLEHSLSLRSLRWRFEAWRSGKSFGEVVMLHSLVYRVEQAFLIHQPSGLLLQHVVAPKVEAEDGHMVSGMLTAVQSFVADSFHARPDETLQIMRVGELTVYAERGPHAVLATVVRGTPPTELRLRLKETLESIHGDLRRPLENFQGDATPFAAAQQRMESCLEEVVKEPGPKKAPWKAIAFLALAVIGVTWWTVSAARASSKWEGYVDLLRAEPGIAVVSAEASGDDFYLTGLRDPLATDPAQLFAEQGFEGTLHASWQPYHATNAELVRIRAERILAPPEMVQLRVEETTLVISGIAEHEWLEETRIIARALAGVEQVDTSDLRIVGRHDRTLQRAFDVLRPPANVSLRMDDDVLIVSGEPTRQWVAEARLLSRVIPGVKELRIEGK